MNSGELEGTRARASTYFLVSKQLVVEYRHVCKPVIEAAPQPRYIETLPCRGYRFIAPIENGAPPKLAPVELRVVPVPILPKPRHPWYKHRLVVAAGIAGLLIVAALVTGRVFFARPVLTEADVILAASFVNKTGDPIFDSSLDKALEVKLAESPFLSLFSEANVRETLRMMRHDPNEPVTPELGIEICKRQGLKALVVPEIAAVGRTYLITLGSD